jgi:hypothetical protein
MSYGLFASSKETVYIRQETEVWCVSRYGSSDIAEFYYSTPHKQRRFTSEILDSGVVNGFASMSFHRCYFIRLYFLNAATTRSPGKPKTRMPSAPVIVCAASIALTPASSVASIVA